MSSTDRTLDSTDSPNYSSFLFARLGSFVAFLPLGVWSIAHLWNNLSAFRGAAAWEQAVTEHSSPLAQLLLLVVILGPLVLHIIWGISQTRASKPNLGRYPTFNNLRYLLQRLSALGLLGFLGAHLWLAMFKPRLTQGHAERFVDIAREMHHHGPTLIVYLLGTLGLAYHLANGLQTFAFNWGVAQGRQTNRKLTGWTFAAFALFLAMGWGAIYALWTAGSATA